MPLSDLIILDMSRVLAGPYCTQLFADLGATVWKLEPPQGDETRGWGPPFLAGESAYYLSVNKGKESFSVNLKDSRGQDLIKKLAQKADVLVENFKVGNLARYGLDYSSLKQHSPGLVYCSITGFGQTGPRAKEAGYDAAMQGMTGLMSMTGEAEGEPVKVGVAVIDVLTGLHATVAILAALHERQRTGKGKHLDISLFEVGLASLVNQVQTTLITGQSPARLGSAHPQLVPYQAFRAKDDYFVLAVGNDRQFAQLCQVIHEEHLAEDKRFMSNKARVENRQELIAHLSDIFEKRNKESWLTELIQAGVPAMPVNTLVEALQDPQTEARDLIQTYSHPKAGEIATLKSPIGHMPIKAPPLLGQHSRSILKILNLSDSYLDELEQSGVIICSSES
ncbi:MAG: CoA transferase [Trueperaceae bacterium]|nr:CoA transferase [Trueperaceae bacterium]